MITTHLVMFKFLDGASADATPTPSTTYTVNWLSPSIRMCLFLLALWGLRGGR